MRISAKRMLPELLLLRSDYATLGRLPLQSTWNRQLRESLDMLPVDPGCLGDHLTDANPYLVASGRADTSNSAACENNRLHQKRLEKIKIPWNFLPKYNKEVYNLQQTSSDAKESRREIT